MSCVCAFVSRVCLCLLLDVWGRGLFWGSFLCSVLVCASTWYAWSSACTYRSFLCVRVSASGDVISGVCVVPDRSSLAESVSYLISSDKILFLMFVFCLSVVFLVLLLCVGRIR